jgi:hypothetical protein
MQTKQEFYIKIIDFNPFLLQKSKQAQPSIAIAI